MARPMAAVRLPAIVPSFILVPTLPRAPTLATTTADSNSPGAQINAQRRQRPVRSPPALQPRAVGGAVEGLGGRLPRQEDAVLDRRLEPAAGVGAAGAGMGIGAARPGIGAPHRRGDGRDPLAHVR